MRTTLTIDDDLLAQARQRAATYGVSLSAIINRSLRRGLAEPDGKGVAAATVVYDPGTPPVDAGELARRINDAETDDLAGDAGL